MAEEEVLEQGTVESKIQNIKVYTSGEWKELEEITSQVFEIGKTYNIKVSGHCQFMISAEKPNVGIATNEITYTKQDGLKLWIKTGE